MRGGSSKVVVAFAAGVLAVTLGGCGSSTAPRSVGSAVFFDSIYTADVAKGTALDSAIAQFVASELELPAAYGAQPTSLAVTTTGGNATWRGFAMEIVFSQGDSGYYLGAFDDDQVTQIVKVEQFPPSGEFPESALSFVVQLGQSGAFLTSAASTSATASTSALGAPCALQGGLNEGPTLAHLLMDFMGSSFTCTSATFTFSAAATFSSSQMPPFGSWSIPSTTFKGPRFAAVVPSPLQRNLGQNLGRSWIGGRRQ
jgi:hypothetical protein